MITTDGVVVHGTYDPRFADLVKALEDELVNGDEVGAALAVDVDGVSVVDVWGGYADGARSPDGPRTPSSTCGRPPNPSACWRH